MQDYDAKLGIYSVSDNSVTLTEKLETKFKDKYLDVVIFENLKKNDLSKLSYLIINLLDSYKNINEIKSVVYGLECKIIILLPLYIKFEEKFVMDSALKDLLEINNNIGVMLVPELLGDGVKYNEFYISHDLIMQSILSERVKVSSSSSLVNTISVNKLIDKIVAETFSFGISGQILALVGPMYGQKSFAINFLGISKDNIIVSQRDQKKTEVERTSSSRVDFSLSRAVKKTKIYFNENVEQSESVIPASLVIPEISSKKLNTKKSNFAKRLFKILLFGLFFLILPLVLLFMSLIFLFFASKTSLKNIDLSQKFISYSLKSVSVSQKISLGIPFYYNYSNIIYKTAFLLEETLEMSKVGNEFATKIMGKGEYDLTSYSDNISASIDRIHTDIGFLQSDINELNDFLGLAFKRYLLNSDIDIARYKDKTYQGKRFFSRASVLLGMEKPMKYLVLFQNNMELRPTGGFIGSFAIISFDKGRMTEIVVNDVYTADGQLNGHVDPPEPIREHLGEGGWFMRDSNWDPSFPESASKAEWFLDKELNIKVDGVVAIDLNFVQKLLKITGPLDLLDFDKVITAENLYANTQNEVESNFFPGSIKKASFMTSLSKKIISEVESFPKEKYFALIKEIYLSLEERHLQLYFHDLNTQDAINNLNYSGEIGMNTDCGLRCIKDTYSLIDANLGVNKSNIYIKREQEVNLNIKKNSISHELFVTYQNTASQAVGNPGFYKTYSRILLPQNANVSGVRLYSINGSFEDLKFDKFDVKGRQEIGFLVNILPGDTKKVQIVWNINTDILANGGEYNLLVRKQAGTENDNLTIKIKESDLSLTGRALSVYTTTLVRDFSIKLFFKP